MKLVLSFIALALLADSSKAAHVRSLSGDSDVSTENAKLTRNKPNLRASVGSVRLVESQADLEELMKESKLVLIDFHEKWENLAEPIFLEAESEKYGDEVVFAKADIQKMPEVAMTLGIDVTPTFDLYKNGEVIDELRGVKDATPKAVIGMIEMQLPGMIESQLEVDALES
eukprot:scaffold4851_cov79-Cyclotella_meneghiniana.AAC.3